MGRSATLAALFAIAASGCGASAPRTAGDDPREISTANLVLSVREGWQGRVLTEAPSPPTLEAGNFVLPPPGYPHGNGEPWPARAIFIRVVDWTDGATSGMCNDFSPALRPLAIGRDDLLPSMEGVPVEHGFDRRFVSVSGRLLEINVEFDQRTDASDALARANEALAGLRVDPS